MSGLSAASDVELGARLSAVLESRLGPGVTVDDLVRLAGGSSRESWRFTALAADGVAHHYVLRRDPPGVPASGVRLESQLLSAAAAKGVPVPTVVVAGGVEAGLGAAFVVVDFLDGETIPRRILRDDRLAGARAQLWPTSAVRCSP